jgi:hypothetical protein
MSFPLSTADILDNDISNRPTDNLFQRSSNQRIDYNQQRYQHSSDIPQRSSPHRKKNSRQQKHSVSRNDGTNSRKTDVNIFIYI